MKDGLKIGFLTMLIAAFFIFLPQIFGWVLNTGELLEKKVAGQNNESRGANTIYLFK